MRLIFYLLLFIAALFPRLAAAYAPDGSAVDWVRPFGLGVNPAPHPVQVGARGEARWSYPLALPPARLAPALALAYDSRGGADAELPWGWRLEGILEIRRPANPQRYTHGEHLLLGGPAGELDCRSSPCALVHTQANLAVDARYDAASDTWTVRSSAGLTWTLAPADAGAASGAGTARWRATRWEDPLGEQVEARYDAAGRLAALDYGGNTRTGDPHTTRLELRYGAGAARRVSARGGFVQELEGSLTELRVSTWDGAGWRPVRLWELGWTSGLDSSVSLLSGLREVGLDGATRLAQAPLRFDYAEWSAAGQLADPADWSPADLGRVVLREDRWGAVVESWMPSGLADLNGDGLLDHLRSDGAGTWWVTWQEVDAAGAHRWAGPPVRLAGPPVYLGAWDHRSGVTQDQITALVDLNGDGWPDLVDTAHITGSPSPRWAVWYGDGAGWAASYVEERGPGPALQRELLFAAESLQAVQQLVDLDGDGWLDVVSLWGGGPASVSLHTGGWGAGWDAPQPVDAPWCTDFGADDWLWCGLSQTGVQLGGAGLVTDTYSYGELADVNGDGHIDFVLAPVLARGYGAPASAPWAVYLGDGEGWQPARYWAGPDTWLGWRFQGEPGLDKRTFIALLDVDADGLPDLVDAAEGGGWFRNLGDGFSQTPRALPAWWNRGAGGLSQTEVVGVPTGAELWWVHIQHAGVRDLNHDRVPDSLNLSTPTWPHGPRLIFGEYTGPNLLVEVDNGAGLRTQLGYRPSGQAWPSGDPTQPQALAAHLDLVDWMQTEDLHTGQRVQTEHTWWGGVAQDGVPLGFEGHALETTGGVNQWIGVEESYTLDPRLPPSLVERVTSTDLCRSFAPSLQRCHTLSPGWRLEERWDWAWQGRAWLVERVALRQRGDAGGGVQGWVQELGYDTEGFLTRLWHDGGDAGLARDLEVRWTWQRAGALKRVSERQVWGWDAHAGTWREHERRRWEWDGGTLSRGLLTASLLSGFWHAAGESPGAGPWVGQTLAHGPRGEVVEVVQVPTGGRVRSAWSFGAAVQSRVDDGVVDQEATVDGQGRVLGWRSLTHGTAEGWAFNALDQEVQRELFDATGRSFRLRDQTWGNTSPRSVMASTYTADGRVAALEGQYTDGSGQPWLRWWQASSGLYGAQWTEHDLWGRPVAGSEVCAGSAPARPASFACAQRIARFWDPLGVEREQDRDTWTYGTALVDNVAAWWTETEDEAGLARRARYDAYGRPESVQERVDGVWTATAAYTYDPLGRLITAEDAAGTPRRWSYDGAGRLRRAWSPDLGERRYTWDGALLVRQNDSAGGWATWTHDPHGRLVQQQASDPVLGVATWRYTWDTAWSGALSGHSDPWGEERLGYDALGRLSSAERLNLDGTGALSAWTQELDGQVVSLTLPTGQTFEVERRAGRPVLLREHGLPVLELSWDEQGRLEGWRRPTGLELEVVPGWAGTTEALTLQDAAGVLAQRRYSWLPNGALAAVDDGAHAALFAYSDRGELAEVRGAWTERFTYDAVGNPLTLEEPSGRVWTYSPPHVGAQLPDRSDGAAREVYTYDAAGRVAQIRRGADVVTLRYDGLGRLRLVEQNGLPTLSLERDAQGSVIRRVLGDPRDPLAPTERQHRGWRLRADGVEEVDLVLDGLPLGRLESGQWRWLLPEPGGGVLAAVDDWGTFHAWREEGVWGAPRTVWGQEPRGLHGHRVEPGEALIGTRHRHLLRGSGQWLQPEPLLLEGPAGTVLLDPLALHPYRYGRNAPTAYYDPDGRLVDTVADVGFVLYDVYTIAKDPGDWTNWAALGADVGSALLPGLTGGGVAVRTAAHADEVMHSANAAGKLASEGVQSGAQAGARAGGDVAPELAEQAAKATDAQVTASRADSATRPVRNAHLAGKNHPVTGIPFDAAGYPDFSSVSKADVKISYTGNRAGDFAAANKSAGFPDTPEGFTWHHHQDGTTMQLVPRDIHAKTGHTGGFSNP